MEPYACFRGGAWGGGQLPQQLVRKPWPLRQNTRAETRELKLRTLSVISHAEIPSAGSGVGGLSSMQTVCGTYMLSAHLLHVASPPAGEWWRASRACPSPQQNTTHLGIIIYAGGLLYMFPAHPLYLIIPPRGGLYHLCRGSLVHVFSPPIIQNNTTT